MKPTVTPATAASGKTWIVDILWALALSAIPFLPFFLHPNTGLLGLDLPVDGLSVGRLLPDSIREGLGIPFWDYRIKGGSPFLANSTNRFFDPIQWISLLFSPDQLHRALGWNLYLHFSFLLLGAIRLCRFLRLRKKEALVAALPLAFSGLPFSSHHLVPAFGAVVVFPWFLVALLNVYRHPSFLSTLSLSAGLAGFVYLGAPVYFPLAFLASLAFLLTKPGFRSWRAEAWVLPALFLLTFLASAAQLIPGTISELGAGRLDHYPYENMLKWSLDPRRTLELVLPHFFGLRSDVAPALQPSLSSSLPVYFQSLYLGTSSVFLLLRVPFYFWRSSANRWLLALAALLLAYSLGPRFFLHPLLYDAIPWLRSIRYPERFFLPAFLLGQLALIPAWRVYFRLSAMRSGKRPVLPILPLLAALVALISAAVPWGTSLPLAGGSCLVLGTFLLLFSLMEIFLARHKFSFAPVPAVFLLLAGLDLFLHDQSLLWRFPAEWIAPQSQVLAKQWSEMQEKRKEELEKGGARKFSFIESDPGPYSPKGPHAHFLVDWNRNLFTFPAFYGIETIHGDDRWAPPGRIALIHSFLGKDQAKLLDLFGVSYGMTFLKDEFHLVRRPNPLPYLFFPSAVHHAPSLNAAIQWASLSSPSLHHVAIEAGTGEPQNPSSANGLRILRRHGQGMDVSLPALDQARWLVWQENFHREWRAHLDGRSLKVHRANGWAMAVLLPAGPARVLQWSFSPVSFWTGTGLTAFWILMAACSLARHFRDSPTRCGFRARQIFIGILRGR